MLRRVAVFSGHRNGAKAEATRGVRGADSEQCVGRSEGGKREGHGERDCGKWERKRGKGTEASRGIRGEDSEQCVEGSEGGKEKGAGRGVVGSGSRNGANARKQPTEYGADSEQCVGKKRGCGKREQKWGKGREQPAEYGGRGLVGWWSSISRLGVCRLGNVFWG